jgi:hypothetical protein
MDAYQQYIHKSRYARYLPEEKRRETWEETVNRYVNYWVDRADLNDFEVSELFKCIHDLDVMPSMRALMTAGEALDRDNVAGFNCSYLPIDHPKAFDEMMYVLMCGTGVGYSVERQYVQKLPEYDLQVPRLKFLEVEQAVQNLCLTCSDSQLTSFGERLDENLAPLSATIFAARLLKLSSLEESGDQPSSVSAISQTTDCDDVSTDSGGLTTPNVD